ncbi:MAG: carboxypeptidase [Aaplasma endosymbiont of Hyalomma asiaticum]
MYGKVSVVVYMKHYKFLEQIFAKIRNISGVVNELCKGMSSIPDCANKIRTLQEIRQELIDSDVVTDALSSSLSNKGQLSDWEVANLHCMSRMHKNLRNIPSDLTSSLTIARVNCKNAWMSFKESGGEPSDTKRCLADVVKLLSEIASIKSSDISVGGKYDVMLKMHDGDLDSKRIDEAFTDIGAFFRQFFGEVLEKQNSSKVHVAKSISCDKQKMLHDSLVPLICEGFASENNKKLEELGYCECGYSESWRVSCYEDDYRVGLRGALENAGYALYLHNLPKKQEDLPVGGFAGSVMYEAQGQLMSSHILKDSRFLEFAVPILKKLLSLRGKAAYISNIQLYLSQVKPDVLLRRSDEVSMIAHIMLRYALEKELINGDLDVNDLSDAWAQGMKYYFDTVPQNDSEGFLQDGYWVSGIFGYLPSKLLGAIAATQIFYAIQEQRTDILGKISEGDFTDLAAWLRKYIYSHGGRYSSTMILKKITGKRVDVDSYKNHLVSRYLSM